VVDQSLPRRCPANPGAYASDPFTTTKVTDAINASLYPRRTNKEREPIGRPMRLGCEAPLSVAPLLALGHAHEHDVIRKKPEFLGC